MTSLNRRALMGGFATASALGPFLALHRAVAQHASGAPMASENWLKDLTVEEAQAFSDQAHERLEDVPGLTMYGQEQVAMLLYPNFTALDLVGPHYMFASMMGAHVHLVTTEDDLSPVASDLTLAIAPTMTLADMPKDLDVLFVPGGTMGTVGVMENERAIDLIADRASRARYITSVCTGSLILGQAGLLEGKRATSHWVTRPLLTEFGATPVDARVVTDGNIVTGAGVSAGLDFGLSLVAELRGTPYAQAIQLQAEYAPAPPFDAGTYEDTPPAVAEPMRDMFAPLLLTARNLAQKRRKAL